MVTANEEITLLQAQLQSNIKTIEEGVAKAVESVARNCQRKLDGMRALSRRKDNAISALRLSLRNRIAAENRSNALNAAKIAKLKDTLKGLGREVLILRAAMKKARKEMEDLRKENQALRAKNKEKGRKIKQYKLHLDDVKDGAKYCDDEDESDGTPSDDSSGAEDIKMMDEDMLLNADEADSTDPEDSEYDPKNDGKVILAKDESVEEDEMKEIEADEEINAGEELEDDEEIEAGKELEDDKEIEAGKELEDDEEIVEE